MLTHDYTYTNLLDRSVTNAWTVEDCYQGRDFDFTKSFLPERIAGVHGIACLNDDEKRKLNQIRGNSYCHIFGFVEEYIVPMVVANAGRDIYGDETRPWSLLRFAEEEVKHQEMLRRACEQFANGFGVHCGLIPGREAVAEVVLGKSPLTALLLTSMIEWFTQLPYVEHVRDSEELDNLFRDSCASIGSTSPATPGSTHSSSTRWQPTSRPRNVSRPSTNSSSSVARWTACSPNSSSSTSKRWH
jgi:hypothetical protein